MMGLMQDWPLLIHRIIDHAAIQHGTQEIVSRSLEGPIHRTTYAEVRQRALKGAKRLTREGVRAGDRVATLAWNSWRHVEAWYAIAGTGAVYHTVNPRLFAEQIVWIINHATDRILMLDACFVPLAEKLAAQLPSIERYIVLTDVAHMPETNLRNAVSYEEWLAETDDDFAWASLDERAAAGLCYTSGTTGNPKGVLYSHRSNVLHAMQVNTTGSIGPSANDCVLCIVPMFHANAWALPFSLPMAGAKMVMPGAKLDGASVFELIDTEAVTLSAGVPTVWLMLLDYMTAHGKCPSTLRHVAVGGAACPRAMIERFERDFGINVFHAWGMTETSPVGTTGIIKPVRGQLEGDALFDQKVKQGSAPFGVEMIITDDGGNRLPWDGVAVGRLKVRGPCVSRAYYLEDQPILDADGFFDTGDIAAIEPDGTMRITDRSKDVIKSGGEWISSIEIENLAMSHPAVAEAAVIGVPHPKWTERPLLIVVPAKDKLCDPADLLRFFQGKIASWWIPGDVQYIDEIPHTAAGKISKLRLREIFRDYRLPEGRD